MFREFLKERARVRDMVQAVSVGPKGTTEAPADNKGSVAVEGVVEGSVAKGGGKMEAQSTSAVLSLHLKAR